MRKHMSEENTKNLFVRKFILYSVVILFLLSLVAIYLSENSNNKEDVDGAIIDLKLAEQRSSSSGNTIFNYQQLSLMSPKLHS